MSKKAELAKIQALKEVEENAEIDEQLNAERDAKELETLEEEAKSAEENAKKEESEKNEADSASDDADDSKSSDSESSEGADKNPAPETKPQPQSSEPKQEPKPKAEPKPTEGHTPKNVQKPEVRNEVPAKVERKVRNLGKDEVNLFPNSGVREKKRSDEDDYQKNLNEAYALIQMGAKSGNYFKTRDAFWKLDKIVRKPGIRVEYDDKVINIVHKNKTKYNGVADCYEYYNSKGERWITDSIFAAAARSYDGTYKIIPVKFFRGEMDHVANEEELDELYHPLF